MIWQNAWAWLGLAAIAIPIAIHLLARRSPRRVVFPTLRFLPATPPLAVTRHRLTDVALLVVRCAILAAAVAALAQPFVATTGRATVARAETARAIVVDTSVSMNRPAASGRRASDLAREAAQAERRDAMTTITIDQPDLPHAIRAAGVWLDRAAGARELVVISDFQAGAVSAADIARIAPDVGVRLVPLAIAGETIAGRTIATAPPVRHGPLDVTARMTLRPEGTDVEWTSAPASPDARPAIRVVASPADEPVVTAALAAAFTAGVPAWPAERAVIVAFPGATERDALVAASRPIDQGWMVAALAQAGSLAPAALIPGSPPALLVLPASTDGVAAAALLAHLMRAMAGESALAELEPARIPENVLRQWERPATPLRQPRPASDRDESDGRWFWIAALALLAIETLIVWRRGARRVPITEAAYDRVA